MQQFVIGISLGAALPILIILHFSMWKSLRKDILLMRLYNQILDLSPAFEIWFHHDSSGVDYRNFTVISDNKFNKDDFDKITRTILSFERKYKWIGEINYYYVAKESIPDYPNNMAPDELYKR